MAALGVFHSIPRIIEDYGQCEAGTLADAAKTSNTWALSGNSTESSQDAAARKTGRVTL
jgi:hypothetical protein